MTTSKKITHKEMAKLAIAAREKIGLTYQKYADLIGANKRSLFEWENGEKIATQSTQVLLRLIASGKIGADDLESIQ